MKEKAKYSNGKLHQYINQFENNAHYFLRVLWIILIEKTIIFCLSKHIDIK